MKKNTLLRLLVVLSGAMSLFALSSLVHISPLLGSLKNFFGIKSILVPLSGFWAGAWGASGVTALIAFFHFFWSGTISLSYLAYVVPGYCASLYWAFRNKFFMALCLPILCMILFIAHPVGLHAYWYTWYWFIPMGLSFVKNKNYYIHALSSTFIAHAVGSVIWIYTVSMTVEQWYALLPIVVIERFGFAAGMVLVCYFVDMLAYIFEHVRSYLLLDGSSKNI